MAGDQDTDWDDLEKISLGWLEQAHSTATGCCPNSTNDEAVVADVAAYCVVASREYLATAFDALKAGRTFAAFALCRPVVEIGFTFLWCISGEGAARDRVGRWIKDTLDERVQFLSAVSKTSTFANDPSFVQPAKEELSQFDKYKKLPDMRQMLEDVEQQVQGKAKVTDLYPILYKFLCESSHAPLCLERYFRSDTEVLTKIERPAPGSMAVWVILTAAFYVAASIFLYANVDFGKMKSEYEAATSNA